MYYLYPLNELKICFQSESHKNITKSKQSRKCFVSPVKFTKVHVRGFVNEPTICGFMQLAHHFETKVRFLQKIIKEVYSIRIFKMFH